MKVGEIYGKNRNKKLLVMSIDFFLMTLFGAIYNIYTYKNYYIYLYNYQLYDIYAVRLEDL